MRRVDPSKLKSIDKIAILTHPEGRGYTFDEMVTRLYPEYPGCGHDHKAQVAAGIESGLRNKTLLSYTDDDGRHFYALTWLGYTLQSIRLYESN